MNRPRLKLALVIPGLLLVDACSNYEAPLGLDSATFAVANVTTIDEFDPWDPSVWLPGQHTLGRGVLQATNVSATNGILALMLPAGTYEGAEIRSRDRRGPGVYEVRMRTPVAPGSLSAFFLYEFVARHNDEIDIEIFNDGTRRILLTTWVRGKQTNSVTLVLPFDPAAAFHDYRIEYGSARVAFYADGLLLHLFKTKLPRTQMYVMANTWWPTWLTGPQPTADVATEIDRVIY
jgi:beta-glucanase (GH16 family)